MSAAKKKNGGGCTRCRHTRDEGVALRGPAKVKRIDLGLALLQAIALPGVSYNREEIAAWAGCTSSAIWIIERQALEKFRRVLRRKYPAVPSNLLSHL